MTVEPHTTEQAMLRALALATEARDLGEVPVGAVVLHEGLIIGEGYNQREGAADPTGHAEMLAIRQAARALGSWRLLRCTLIVTLEPCAMCAGAIVHARIPTLVFAAHDPRYGAVGSVLNLVQHPKLNHRAEVQSGLLAEPAGLLLREFFAARRRRSRLAAPGANGS